MLTSPSNLYLCMSVSLLFRNLSCLSISSLSLHLSRKVPASCNTTQNIIDVERIHRKISLSNLPNARPTKPSLNLCSSSSSLLSQIAFKGKSVRLKYLFFRIFFCKKSHFFITTAAAKRRSSLFKSCFAELSRPHNTCKNPPSCGRQRRIVP